MIFPLLTSYLLDQIRFVFIGIFFLCERFAQKGERTTSEDGRTPNDMAFIAGNLAHTGGCIVGRNGNPF